MQHDPEQAQHLHRWQKPYFDGKVAEAYPAQKADALRGQCGQIQYAWATDNITELTASMLLKQYAEKYVNVVDNTDGNTGSFLRNAPTPRTPTMRITAPNAGSGFEPVTREPGDNLSVFPNPTSFDPINTTLMVQQTPLPTGFPELD
ncbi:FIGNL1 [Branchiostoma lanceolatum]|uniref:FIGNL1 protein n=1 Tax=Branchiostoma lanceolatum TaxID=7740 RepID=A0A8K0ELX6_BRALA|nr:FIGNL1 [Branchiostoma lanceolatum]